MNNSQTLVLTYFTSRCGVELELSFPARFAVCSRCDGRGKHVNPSIDGHGISREEFDEDPQFEEDYFSGVYDVTCSECRGERVVLVFDESHATKRQRARYAIVQRQLDEAAADRAANARTAWYESGCPA